MDIRNIAIIAHVDHGKTTLTDAIMTQCGHGDEGTMDSNALEQERGITIYAKNTSIMYKDTKINIVDTPGHADFGSEVERVLRSIDTVLLVVDAQEGPMPQTRFVLKKSLELGLKPIVIINKIDKPAANPDQCHEMVLELFMELGANDAQLDFPTIYAIGRQGVAMKKLDDPRVDLTPLLDMVLEHVPPANKDHSATAPLTAQTFNLGYDNFLGRLAIARVYDGTIKTGQTVFEKKIDGSVRSGKITKLFVFEGKKRVEIQEATAGDIVTVAGFPEIYIGETLTDKEETPAMPAIKIDEPTISLNFFVNSSPFAGREGKFVTGRQIRERLEKELEINVGLKVDFGSNEYFRVYGRGELHIAVLLENMRREGYELQVSQPQVIVKEIDGVKSEPFEEVTLECPEGMSGSVIEKMGRRKAEMKDMKVENGIAYLQFVIPTRGLIGYRTEFMMDTRGQGILNTLFLGYQPHVGVIDATPHGSLIVHETGESNTYGLQAAQERGQLFIGALQLFIGGLQFFMRRFEFLLGRFQDRKSVV